MEKTDYCTGKRYADIMKTMWFTYAYAPAIHIGALISVVGMVIYYWVDKYNILRRRVVKENISMDLSIQMIENLEYTVVFFTVFFMSLFQFSAFFFQLWLVHIFSISTLIMFVVGIIYTILPMQVINEWLFPIEKTHEVKSFDEASMEFDTVKFE